MLPYQSCVTPLLSSEAHTVKPKVWKTTKAPLTLPILSYYTLNIHVHNLTVTFAFYICAPQFRGMPLLITESHRKVMVPGLSLAVPWLPVAIAMGFTIWIVWTQSFFVGPKLLVSAICLNTTSSEVLNCKCLHANTRSWGCDQWWVFNPLIISTVPFDVMSIFHF